MQNPVRCGLSRAALSPDVRLRRSCARLIFAEQLALRQTRAAGSGGRSSALCGFVDLQPAGEGIPKLVAQIDDLASGRLTVPLSRLAQQRRQLGDVGRDPSRLNAPQIMHGVD
jgi:hypothetical protein